MQEICADAAVASIWSEPDGKITFKEEKQTAVKAFLSGKKTVFPSPPTGFGKSQLTHSSTSQLAMCTHNVSLAPLGSPDLPQTGSTGTNKSDYSAINMMDRLWMGFSPDGYVKLTQRS